MKGNIEKSKIAETLTLTDMAVHINVKEHPWSRRHQRLSIAFQGRYCIDYVKKNSNAKCVVSPIV